MCFWKYFLPVCDLSSYSLDSVFCRVEVFNFNEIQFTHFFPMDYAFVVVSKKSSPNSKLSKLSPMLSSRNFIAFCFPFRFMIHFELIFAKGKKSVSRCTFWPVDVQLFQQSFLEKTILSPLNCLYLFVKDQITRSASVYFWTLFHWSVYSFASTTLSYSL